MDARLRTLEQFIKGTPNRSAQDVAFAKRLAAFEAVGGAELLTMLPARLDALETSISSRLDQAMSAVGRVEILSSRLDEFEDTIIKRLDILEARGEGLRRRLDSPNSVVPDDWTAQLSALRREFEQRWMAEAAAQPWRDELTVIRDEFAGLRDAHDEGSGQTVSPETLAVILADLARLKDNASSKEHGSNEVETLKAELADRDVLIKRITERLDALEEAVPTDLTHVKGIGPKFARALKTEGIKTASDVGAIPNDELDRLATALGTNAKRLEKLRAAAQEYIG